MAVTSIPTQGRSPTALIIQVLDPQALGEIVAGQATMEGTTTLLMDSSGQLLCESGNPALAGQLMQMAGEKRLESHVELGNKSYYLLQKQLEEKTGPSSRWCRSLPLPGRVVGSGSSRWCF